jgi:hypothetical protein
MPSDRARVHNVERMPRLKYCRLRLRVYQMRHASSQSAMPSASAIRYQKELLTQPQSGLFWQEQQ